MLLRLIIFISMISFISCTKDPPATLVGTVSFSANGTSYSWTENNDYDSESFMSTSIYASGGDTYHLNISNAFASHSIPFREVFLTFKTASLVTGTPFTHANTIADNLYAPHDIAVSPSIGIDQAYLYKASKIGDAATITITSIHGDYADGTFSATLTRASDQAVLNITSGNFKNIRID
ncbi:MAG: hypothetical protein V4556_12900 [Bacteroidota bacterium]